MIPKEIMSFSSCGQIDVVDPKICPKELLNAFNVFNHAFLNKINNIADCFIAGGAIRQLLNKERNLKSDLDLFFSNKKQYDKFNKTAEKFGMIDLSK